MPVFMPLPYSYRPPKPKKDPDQPPLYLFAIVLAFALYLGWELGNLWIAFLHTLYDLYYAP